MGRFLSIDPLAAVTAGVSPYAAMDNNPVSMVDPLGLQPGPNWLEAPNNRPSFNVYSLFAASKAYFAQTRANAEKENLAQGNNSQSQGTCQVTGNMTDGFTIEGITVQGKSKGPGFFGRIANSIKRFLGWGDDKVQGHTIEEVKKQEQPGGEEFTDKNVGVAHSGHTATFFNRKWSINNAGNLITLAGGWGTNPSAIWSNWKSNFDFFTNTYNLTTDGTSQLNDVMKPYSGWDSKFEFNAPTKTYKIHYHMGGVSSSYDADTDTTGMNAAMEEALRNGRNRP